MCVCKIKACLYPCIHFTRKYPDSKVHEAKIGPICVLWVLSDPNGPHVVSMNLAMRVWYYDYRLIISSKQMKREVMKSVNFKWFVRSKMSIQLKAHWYVETYHENYVWRGLAVGMSAFEELDLRRGANSTSLLVQGLVRAVSHMSIPGRRTKQIQIPFHTLLNRTLKHTSWQAHWTITVLTDVLESNVNTSCHIHTCVSVILLGPPRHHQPFRVNPNPICLVLYTFRDYSTWWVYRTRLTAVVSGPLLLTWFNYNSNMDEWSYAE